MPLIVRIRQISFDKRLIEPSIKNEAISKTHARNTSQRKIASSYLFSLMPDRIEQRSLSTNGRSVRGDGFHTRNFAYATVGNGHDMF